MHKFSTRDLTLAALIAAVYAVLTVTLPIPQYSGIQVRLAEALTVLPFLFPAATPGLVVGCFIDNISSTVILTPILLPIVAGIGMSPIQFGIVMTVNLAIGFITPPYGCNLFFASAISNVSVVDIAKKILPMIGVMLIVLMALTFIPALSVGILDFL